MPASDTLITLLRRIAAYGDAPAIVAFGDDGSATTSFAALAEAAQRVAAELARRGVARGACVAIIGPNAPAWVVAFWGIVAHGAVAMPLDAQLNDEDAARMIESADCRLAFAPAARAARLPKSCEVIPLDAQFPEAPAAAATPDARPGDVALQLFTSGTTGTPKAVPLTHANLLSNVEALMAAGLVAAGDRALLPLPFHHAYPLTVGMMTGLASGVALILPAGVSGPQLLTALQQGRATVLLGVPRLYTALLAGILQRVTSAGGFTAKIFTWLLGVSARLRPMLGTRPGRVFFHRLHKQFAPDLRLLVSGGAKLDDADEIRLAALGWQVMTGYGLTETSPILAFNRPRAARAGSAGRPLPGVALRIANADENGVGEVQARGASVFAGYRGDPEATKRAFTQDNWFRTGDFGRIDLDGYLFIVARLSETIVLADGKKLYPETIEAVYAAHPLVKEIALLAVDGALVALVVPDLDKVRELGAVRMKDLLRDALAERAQTLPPHARLTGFAIARDRLPRTQLGKIRRHLLPALYAQALTAHAPTGPAEITAEDKALLADAPAEAAWHWLSGRFPGRVLDLDMSPQLDLGIDLLGWVDLSLALQRELGVTLTEHEIGRIVTLRDFLREVVAARGKPATAAPAPAVAIEPLGPGLALIREALAVLTRLGMRRFFALRVEGVENLPARGPFILCPNHESYLDPFAIAAALPHGQIARTWWAGWTGFLYTTRLRRLFSRAAQVLPVDQYRGASASLEMGTQVLARGDILVWFPEGGLTRDGKLQPFQAGIGLLAMRHQVPIVPVAISGSYEAWPYRKKFPPNRHPIRVRFGTPVDPAALLADATEPGLPQRVADQLHDTIAALLAASRKEDAGR